MKVLKLSALLCLTYSATLLANDGNYALDKYISNSKKKQFEYDYEKNEAESSKLSNSWIAPIKLNYSYSKSKPYVSVQTNQNAAIKIDQPIFQSGGIYYGIKYANATKRYLNYSADVAKRKMIKDAVSILMQIKQTSFIESKQKLQILNSQINLEQKKEQYLAGQLDSGFLDDAIIQRNTITQALYDVQTTKEKLISQFEVLSDLPYAKASIPHLEFVSAEDFIKGNIVLKNADALVQKNRYYKKATVAKYLPKISLTAGYNWLRTENQQFSPTYPAFSNELLYYDYGIKASMDLNINTFSDIESARVDYLKSILVIEDKKIELNSLFEQIMRNIENFDKKIKLSNESKEIYAKLLEDTRELFVAGYKTQYDVDLLENSFKIQNLDSEIFGINKQLELLTLYETYVNDSQ